MPEADGPDSSRSGTCRQCEPARSVRRMQPNLRGVRVGEQDRVRPVGRVALPPLDRYRSRAHAFEFMAPIIRSVSAAASWSCRLATPVGRDVDERTSKSPADC